MEIFIPKKRWSDDVPTIHIIEKKRYTQGSLLKLIDLQFMFECGKKVTWVEGDGLETYNKEVHPMKRLCKECVRIRKLIFKRNHAITAKSS